MAVTVTPDPTGWHELTVGKPPHDLKAMAHPVGTISLHDDTVELLRCFDPEYIPALIELLQAAHDLVVELNSGEVKP